MEVAFGVLAMMAAVGSGKSGRVDCTGNAYTRRYIGWRCRVASIKRRRTKEMTEERRKNYIKLLAL